MKKKGIDVVFIYGLHICKQSLNDVLNSLNVLNDKGVIIHDCNPISETAATSAKSIEDAIKMDIPGWTGQWNGDV